MKLYKLFNRTDIPNEILNVLVNFACPPGLNNFSVSILPSKEEYSGIRGEANLEKKRVRVWVGNSEYPNFSIDESLEKFGYKPNFIVNDKEEDLLTTLAHELRHLWQENVSKRTFTDGKIHRYTHWDKKNYISIEKMESDSCKYSYKILKKFRKEINKITA
jgi:hypothetical protein